MKQQIKNEGKKGFTLVEVLATLAILSIVVVAIVIVTILQDAWTDVGQILGEIIETVVDTG